MTVAPQNTDPPRPTPDQPGRRERRKTETRRRLLEAGRALIAESGTEALRMADVAARADVGFGTVYTYYASKDALVEAVVSEVMARTAELIGTRALESEDPAETAAISYRSFLAYAHEEPEFAAALISLPDAERTFEAALALQARQTLERGIKQGRFDIPDIELALTSVAAAALAAIRATLDGRLAADAATHGALMLLRGFGVPDAQAREIAARPLPRIVLAPT